MTRVLAALLALLLPVVLLAGDPGTTALAVATAAVLALVHLVGRADLRGGRVVAVRPSAEAGVPLVLRGRAADPVTHPRRPRAPGRG